MKLKIAILLIVLLGAPYYPARAERNYFHFNFEQGGGESANELILLAEKVFKKKPLEAIDHLTKALLIAIKAEDGDDQVRAYILLGEINYNLEQYSLSSTNYKKALDIISEEGSNKYKLSRISKTSFEEKKLPIYRFYARSLEKEGKLDEALIYYQIFLDNQNESLPKKQSESSKNSNRKMLSEEEEVQLAMARIYGKKNDLESSKNTISQGVMLDSGINNSPINFSNSSSFNQQAGKILWEQGDAEGRTYLDNSIKQAKSEGRTDVESRANNDLADYYDKKEDYKEAATYRNRNIKILEKENDTLALADNYLKKGISESKLGLPDSAKESIQKAQELGAGIGNLKIQQKSFEELSKLEEEKGNLSEALAFYKKYVQYQDSAVLLKEQELDQKLIISEEYSRKQQKIDLLEKNEEINSKTIELLRASAKNQRILIYSLLSGLLLIFASAYLVYKNMRQRRLANQLVALRSLRSQMNPHFIFNALNSVNLYIAQKDERTANKYLTDFSRLMRLVLEQSQKDFIPLQQELEMIKLYINLEHDRFKDKFDFELTIDPDLDEEALQIPPMLIQPYIENAIWHGLRYKEEKGVLKVVYTLSGNSLKVRVEDNGIGREKSKQIKTKNQLKTQSTGMYNIESRLRIINSMFKTEIRLSVSDLNSDHGTLVEVEIPINDKLSS